MSLSGEALTLLGVYYSRWSVSFVSFMAVSTFSLAFFCVCVCVFPRFDHVCAFECVRMCVCEIVNIIDSRNEFQT